MKHISRKRAPHGRQPRRHHGPQARGNTEQTPGGRQRCHPRSKCLYERTGGGRRNTRPERDINELVGETYAPLQVWARPRQDSGDNNTLACPPRVWRSARPPPTPRPLPHTCMPNVSVIACRKKLVIGMHRGWEQRTLLLGVPWPWRCFLLGTCWPTLSVGASGQTLAPCQWSEFSPSLC